MRVTIPARPCRIVPNPPRVIPFAWVQPDSKDDVQRLDAWCDTVGPPVVDNGNVGSSPRSQASTHDPLPRNLTIATWNVHEGGGDLFAFVNALRRGELTGGRRVDRFVLLLQEAFRESGEVPMPRQDAAVPRRIAPRPPSGRRAGIVDVARAIGAALVYVPSMRNGRAGFEDRGNAIVSTVPLRAVTAIELPFEHQRRVAIAADVADDDGPPMRVVTVHLDTLGGIRSGGPAGARGRQARALVDALGGATEPVIIGGDLNTWSGRSEPGYRELADRLTDPMTRSQPTFRGPFGIRADLDHLFVRPPSGALIRTARVPQRFGSDHHALILEMRWAGTSAGTPLSLDAAAGRLYCKARSPSANARTRRDRQRTTAR